MRIGIDARFYGPQGKGLGRYTQKLVTNLEKVSPQGGSAFGRDSNQYFIFLTQENFDEYQPTNPNFKKVLADCRWYTLKEQLKMPALLNKYNLDLVHFPHFNVPIFYRKKFIVTIHDLILIHYPTIRGTTLNPLFYWLKFLAYKFVIRFAITRAEKVIAVSNFTRKDILSHYAVNPEKVEMTYEAADDFCWTSNENPEIILKKYAIIKPYLLYVGNPYPHKNLEKLILVFADIISARPDLHLVLVGKDDYFYARLQTVAKENNIKNVIFAGYVLDKDLDVVYRQAILYVFPSLYEGFGIPPLEAMAKGTPVASSDHACMQEILGDSAYYFDATSKNKIAEGLIKILNNENLRKELTARGYEQIKKYSWKKMAKQTLEIYQQIADGK
ncbi:MAG: glycosyltransferase family 1 protein [Candidatus Moranbacteria bacterium]|nr:glycosyltransferase family 1 protein [Candidatus Moranbacteria bacterium]